MKEIIPIDVLENFRNDGTQILEIEEINEDEDGDLNEGKPKEDQFGIDPIEIMDQKLELIRILKKPERLRLINPMPTLPQLPPKAAPYLTNRLRTMFSSVSNKDIMLK